MAHAPAPGRQRPALISKEGSSTIVRKWTTSACVVLTWYLLPLMAVAGSRGPEHPVQASISTAASTSLASSTQAVLASESVTDKKTAAADVAAEPAATWTVRPGDTLSAIAAALRVPGGWQALYAANRPLLGPDPDVIRPGAVLALPGTGRPTRYTVAPGDTLSAVAAALGVPGGWQALYAANRPLLGPDPDVIRPGAVLAAPRPAATPAQRQAARGQAPRAASAPARPGHQAPPAPADSRASQHLTAPGGATVPASGMPPWLGDVLIAAGVLAATAFAAEPATALVRRRKAARPAGTRARAGYHARAREIADKTRIILADHERLIVTYSAHDHTVYVLTPPGEDPRAVLRAARLVLPEETYEELAGHLGFPAAWPLE
jgi:LysM repeat protein